MCSCSGSSLCLDEYFHLNIIYLSNILKTCWTFFLRHICICLIRRNPNVVSDQCNGHMPPSNQIQRNQKLLENSAICFNQITHLTVNGPRSLTFGDLHLKFMSSILSEVLVKFRRPFLSNDSIVTQQEPIASQNPAQSRIP